MKVRREMMNKKYTSVDTNIEQNKTLSPQNKDARPLFQYTRFPNEIIEQLARINLSSYEWRTLWVLWRKTWGWHKVSDAISITQFERMTGLKRRHQHRTIVSLVNKGLMIKCIGRCITYEFQNDFTQWNGVTNPGHIPSGGHSPLPIQGTGSLPLEVNTKDKRNYTKEKELLAYFNLRTGRNYQPLQTRLNIIHDCMKRHQASCEQIKRAIDNFSKDTWPDRKNYADVVYCLGVRNKIDNFEKWSSYQVKEDEQWTIV